MSQEYLGDTKHSVTWSRLAFRPTAEPGSGSEGWNSGHVDFGDVSFGDAGVSESRNKRPCIGRGTGRTFFGPVSRHARVLS